LAVAEMRLAQALSRFEKSSSSAAANPDSATAIRDVRSLETAAGGAHCNDKVLRFTSHGHKP
jgi:hypothetical protein